MQFTNNPHGGVMNSSSIGLSLQDYNSLDGGDGISGSGRRHLISANTIAKKLIQFNFVVQNTEPTKYYYARSVKNGTVSCLKSSTSYTQTVNCGNSQSLDFSCSGTQARIYNYTCPASSVVPVCLT